MASVLFFSPQPCNSSLCYWLWTKSLLTIYYHYFVPLPIVLIVLWRFQSYRLPQPLIEHPFRCDFYVIRHGWAACSVCSSSDLGGRLVGLARSDALLGGIWCSMTDIALEKNTRWHGMVPLFVPPPNIHPSVFDRCPLRMELQWQACLRLAIETGRSIAMQRLFGASLSVPLALPQATSPYAEDAI